MSSSPATWRKRSRRGQVGADPYQLPPADGHDHAPWEAVAAPSLSQAELEAVCAKHGLDGQAITAQAATGVINTIYLVGDELVLRVPRNIEAGIDHTLTESVAAPTAHAVGVRTPRLIVFDDDRDILPVPFTVYERSRGVSLAVDRGPSAAVAGVYKELGRDLARLHHTVHECEDPQRSLKGLSRIDPLPLIEALSETNLIGSTTEQWLAGCFDELWPAVEASTAFRRFVHNDAQPSNVMAEAGEYCALIDWGETGWGDPAFEFRHMPLSAVPYALAGYREIAPLDGDDGAEARILWDHLGWAFLRLTERDGTQKYDWAAPRLARILDVMEFAFSRQGSGWLGTMRRAR